MKIKKTLSAFLALSIFASNTIDISLASNNIPNRYQTLEGESISLDNILVDNKLEEIEIFGNTKQNTGSKNLFNSPLEKGYITIDGTFVDSSYSVRSRNFTEVKPNTKYSLRILGYSGNLYIHEYDKDYGVLGQIALGTSDSVFTTSANTKYIKINSYHATGYNVNIEANVQLNEGSTLLDYDQYSTSNLSDIKSVGDLYVDNNGNPILDGQGRKQYKINIASQHGDSNISEPIKEGLITWLEAKDGSQGDNILKDRMGNNNFILKNFKHDNTDGFIDGKLKMNGFARDYNKNVVHASNKFETPCKSFIITLEKNKNTIPWYIMDGRGLEGEGSSSNYAYSSSIGSSFDSSKTRINGILKSDAQNIKNGEKLSIYLELKNPEKFTMSLMCRFSSNETMDGYFYSLTAYDRALSEDEILHNCLKEGTVNKTTTILLPTQLQKIGNTADRLFWDSSKNRYVVEKNVGTKIFTEKDNWVLSQYGNTTFLRVYCTLSDAKSFGVSDTNTTISDLFKSGNYDNNSPVDERTFTHSRDIHFTIKKDKLSTPDLNGFKEWLKQNPITSYYPLQDSKYIDTNITSKIKVPIFKNKTLIYLDSKSGIKSNLIIKVDTLSGMAEEAVETAIINDTLSNISTARLYVNMLPESLYKDQLQEKLNQLFSSEITLDRKTVTSNIDLYIKYENMLSMSLSTNTINFDGYSGIDEIEKLNAINISVNSSLPYSLYASLPNEITNANKSKKLDMDTLKIKESSEASYKTFSNVNNRVVLKDGCNEGNYINHSIDLKLASNKVVDADVYKTVLKFEIEQK